MNYVSFSQDLSQEIGDDKILADHLKLPIQRINDYTLLLQVCKYFEIYVFTRGGVLLYIYLKLGAPSAAMKTSYEQNGLANAPLPERSFLES